VSSFPLTGTNKIDKAALRDSFSAMQTAEQEQGPAPHA